MIRDEAEKLSSQLNECLATCAPGVTCEVEVLSKKADWNAPGGAKPTFVRYKIRISGEGRVCRLDLDEAETLLGDVGPGCDADQLFKQIASAGALVEALEAGPQASL